MAWSIFSQGGGPGAALTWARDFLQEASTQWGVDVDTPGNEQFVYDWEKSEGGGGAFNPLNQGDTPGHPELTTTGSQYGGGAADYASLGAGIQGSIDYLDMPLYAGVKQGLEANQPAAAQGALIASPWASSHYGGGANFSSAPVPATAAPVAGGGASLADIKTPFGTIPFPGPNINATPGGIVGALTGGIVGEIEKGGAYLIAIGAGAALVVAGLYKAANPGKSITQQIGNAASQAGQAASMAAVA